MSCSMTGGHRQLAAATPRRARGLVAVAAAAAICSWAAGLPRLFVSPTARGAHSGLPTQLLLQADASPGAGGFAGGAALQNSRNLDTAIVGRRAAEAEAATGVRVGVLYIPGQGQGFKEAFEKLNVTNATFFQTEVPDAFQMPLAAKLLAMSNTVDVLVAAHGELGEEKAEVLRGYQSVALTTNVAIVPYDCKPEGLASVADTAVAMGEIRQQALFGGGPRKSIFFGIGANKSGTPAKKDKVYF
mmetsp:Transcript_13917/g.29115  ORF Transcript_13917/g.29115 Transcript_13917/m.29115 type:complete len:244 (-) Transcript_13917:161-892(-)